MDRSWVNANIREDRYKEGLKEFRRCAIDNKDRKGDKLIACPCCDCNNILKFSDINEVMGHLVRRGFKKDYTKWIWHGEAIDSNMTSSNYQSQGQGENKSDEMDYVEVDRVDEMIADAQDHFMQQPHIFESLVRDSEKNLYPGCSKFTRLSSTLKLCNLKVKNGWSDKSFTELLKLLHEMLPEENELPTSTYDAKKVLCPLGMDVKKIHACPNDCVLYRNEYEDLRTCPKCGASRYKQKDVDSGEEDRKGVPAKVMWYLPIIPRLKRLFSNAKDAKNLRWHAEGRKEDGKLRHPADSPQWRTIDRKYPEFSGDERNLRLGLCTDGMNPYGTLSCQHSTWPVLLTIYNLPPWLCMKRKYIMLSLLISGPKQPGNNIDVYLEPLIEDLKLLWEEGVSVYDAYTQSNFNLRAMIFCTINDFPAYGNLSGYTVKGAKACPICEDATIDLRLKNCKKNVYMSHRTFLRPDHPYRKRKKPFNNQTETRVARMPLTAKQVYERVKDINVVLGKTYKPPENSLWKKRSIFWDLPYWEHLQVRHCIDLMHVEKNVCDSIIGTMLNVPGKTKDGIKVRKDMQEMGIREELAPQESEKRTYLPPACYTLSRKEKVKFCECLAGVKVPRGYSSNIRKFVSMKDLKLVGMKSHDCHSLMQQLLPVAIRGILPTHVRHVVTRLCFFFNAICSKVIDVDMLDKLQDDIIVTLCQFEMYFPPSFFDIMVHLVAHLVREIKICGPVYLRYMYPFERFMGILKGYMRNRYRPESSIVEGYSTEEAVEFCTEYLAGVETIGIPKSRHEGRLDGQGTIGSKLITPSSEKRNEAHLLVLQHLTEVHPYLEEHMTVLREENPSKSQRWLANEHNRTFVTWFSNRVMCQLSETPDAVSDTIKWLAYGPDVVVRSWEGYDINGYTFYTKRQDAKSTMQNSGVTVEASSTEYTSAKSQNARIIDKKDSYYGIIEDIWELEYKDFKVAVFLCKWVANRYGVRQDELGFTLVDFSRVGHLSEPFTLASQVKQVFYIKDPADNKWSIVLQGKRRILGIGDVVDEEEYNQFDENPPFSSGLPPIHSGEENLDANYMRSDHGEGLWIDHQT